MLRSNRFCLGLALASAMAVGSVSIGCSDGGESVNLGKGGSGGGGSSSSSSASSSSSSSSSGAPACPPNEGIVLSVSELYFGEGNSGEWKKFGWNLDDKVSTGLSKDLCQPAEMGTANTAYPDGEDGIDNSFGKNLLPTILSLYPTWVSDINAGIDNGRFTAIVRMMCVTEPEGDVPSFTTKLLGGTTLGTPPKFDGTDVWPIEPGLLSDPKDPESSTILFEGSSLTGDTYDAGKKVVFIISVPVRTATESTSIKLTLYSARIKMKMGPDRKSSTEGMIGGVLNTEEFVAELKKVGYLMGLCGQPLFDNLMLQVRQASDIMTDGTQDPTKTCDGISMGLGFDMSEAVIGDVGPANPVGNACQ